ncbi:MAG: DUF4442 domain-containing protein [Frankia sp.]
MSDQGGVPAAILQARASIKPGGSDGPDLEQIRAVVDTMVPFNNHVGIRITELAADHAVAEVADRPEFLNHLGTVHAGALFLAAEVSGAGAFSGALAARLGDVRFFALRSSRVAFLKPALGRIRATGTIDGPTIAAVLARGTEERFDLSGVSRLHDDSGLLVAKVDLEYVCMIGAPA